MTQFSCIKDTVVYGVHSQGMDFKGLPHLKLLLYREFFVIRTVWVQAEIVLLRTVLESLDYQGQWTSAYAKAEVWLYNFRN